MDQQKQNIDPRKIQKKIHGLGMGFVFAKCVSDENTTMLF